MKVKQVPLVEKLRKQGFHYDTKQQFEPIIKAVKDSNQNYLEETKSNTKAIQNLDESIKYVKTLESLNKNEVIDSSLSRPIAKLLVPENKSQFRLLDDPDGDNCNDYKIHGEKVSIYDDKILFRETGIVFALQGDFLSMI